MPSSSVENDCSSTIRARALCRLTIHELTGEGWLRSIGRTAGCTPHALRPLTILRFGLNAFALVVAERPASVRFRLALPMITVIVGNTDTAKPSARRAGWISSERVSLKYELCLVFTLP